MNAHDRRLLTATRAGQPGAFDELFRLYAGRVLAFARQLTGNRADAEDLCQEVFVSAYKGLDGFRETSSLSTWLFGICSRRWRDGRRTPRVTTVEFRDGDGGPPSTGSPDAAEAIALRDAIARLDPMLREAFHLVVVQGLTHREAAVALGRPEGTVKWCTATAMRRLREALTDDEKPEREGVRQGNSAAPHEADERRGVETDRVVAEPPHAPMRGVRG